MDRAGPVCVLVRNGMHHGTRISSARIALDEVELIAPSDFNRQVVQLRAVADGTPGAHRLTANLRSAPGSWLEVEIRQRGRRTAEEIASLRALDDLRVAHCMETNFRASQLSPDELVAAATLHERVEFPPGRLLALFGSHAVPIAIVPLPWNVDPVGDEPGAWAHRWLAEQRALFMIEDPRVTFELAGVHADPGGNHQVLLQQLWQGIPVSPGHIELRFDPEGHPLALHGQLVPARDLPPDVSPDVDEAEALRLGLRELGASSGSANLIVLDHVADGSPRTGTGTGLYWHVQASTDEPPSRSTWVDARTGTVGPSRIHEDELHFPNAVVSRATGQICDEVGGELVSTVTREERLYSRLEPPIDVTCGGDATCVTLIDDIHVLDDTLLSMRRFGWSDQGADASGTIDAIPGAAPYRVLFDVRDPRGAFWVRQSQRVHLPPASEADTLWHEFGHGVHQVERNNRQPPDMFITPRIVGESYGDAMALLVQDHLGAVDLALNYVDGTPVRDFNPIECSGYGASDVCDASAFAADSACGPVTFDDNGCREYTRLGMVADEALELRIVREEAGRGRIPVHAASCAFTRPLAFMLDDARDGSFVHGVQISRMPDRLSRLMYTWLFDLAPRDFQLREWELHLWESVLKLGQECPTGCGTGVDVLDIAQRAFWASGYWSPSFALDPSGADYAAGSGPAAAFVPGPVEPAVWVVYADVDRGLRIARIERPFRFLTFDPLSGEPRSRPYPPTIPLRVDGPQAFAAGDPALIHDRASDRAVLAYRRLSDDALVVAQAGLGEFRADGRFVARTILGSPTVAAHEGRLFVAYVSASSGAIEVQHAAPTDAAAVVEVVEAEEPLDVPEHDPFLVSGDGRLLLLTSQGPRRVCDSVQLGFCLDGAHVQAMRTRVGAGWTFRAPFRRAPLPFMFDPPANREPIGNLVFSRLDGVGPSATFYGDRFQVVFPAETTLELAAGTAGHFTFAAGSFGGAAPGTMSRVQGHPIAGLGRLAPVVVEDPAISGAALFVFSNIDGRIVLAHKRSFR